MSGFSKLFSSIVNSTIWREPNHVRLVWITMLAITDQEGFVEASVPGLADLARVSLDECVAALDRLKLPDPWSRSREHEGRRIEERDGGWVLLNYAKYRDLRGSREVSMSPEAIRQRRHRAGVTGVTPRDSSVTDRDPSASASQSVVEVPETTTAKELSSKEDGLSDYCLRLAVAANKGLAADIPRILWSSGSTAQVAEILRGADIPIDFAERVIFDRASTLPAHTAKEVRSLSYFTRVVLEAWERESMKGEMERSPLAPGQRPKPTPIAEVLAVANLPVDVRLCPNCDSPRMYDETGAAAHHTAKHADLPFTFADWKTP